jgi:predicted ATPase
MSKIRIRNFGPIKDGYQDNDAWLDIKKVTIFIGNQGSGKSTVAKLISTLSWLEKSMNRGDTNNSMSVHEFTEYTRFQKIHNYFKEDTSIDYIGDKHHITYDRKNGDWPIIKNANKSKYTVPKIMYVPAERNFLSAISDAYNVKGLPDNLFSFAEELKKAQKATKGETIDLQIGSYQFEYDEKKDSSYVLGKDYKIDLSEASSGLQSFTPMFLVSRALSAAISEKEETLRKNMSVTQSIRMNDEIAQLMLDKSIPESSKSSRVNEIREKYYNKCFINIVEEPEQNLFPTSQQKMLYSLLDFNNINEGNKLIITTHSPYLINYLTLAVKAHSLKSKIKDGTAKNRLNQIVPAGSTVAADDVAIYELHESDGSIKKLEPQSGLPSDANELNLRLDETNELFARLLEIQQGL